MNRREFDRRNLKIVRMAKAQGEVYGETPAATKVSYAAIGTLFGISGNRVRQIAEKLKRLRVLEILDLAASGKPDEEIARQLEGPVGWVLRVREHYGLSRL